jgi:hypothetical protein
MTIFSEPAAVPEVLREEEKFAILAQLERLLAAPYFSHSRRFPAFLRYIVHATINGQGELLKERTIGVEIFGKSPDYDTALDPIVRVTAGEIRKRIAQYYQDPGHEHEPRLFLQPGSYIPQFHFPGSGAGPAEPIATEEPEPLVLLAATAAPDTHVEAQVRGRSRRARTWFIASAAVLLLAASAAFFAYWKSSGTSGFAEFWDPILRSPDPVLVCIADQTQYTAIALRDAQDPTHQVTLKDNLTAVIIDDLNTVIKLAGLLQSSGRRYSLRGENATTLTDLRNGPSVIIGAFDNMWTLRLLRPLRYHFANNPDMTLFSIVDGAQHEQPRWVLDRKQQVATNNYRDYAIVARFTDDITGKPTLIAAGIARGGTIAAGEFLTNPALIDAVWARRPSAQAKNVEVVLSTEIINGEPGTPRVEAVYFW